MKVKIEILKMVTDSWGSVVREVVAEPQDYDGIRAFAKRQTDSRPFLVKRVFEGGQERVNPLVEW